MLCSPDKESNQSGIFALLCAQTPINSLGMPNRCQIFIPRLCHPLQFHATDRPSQRPVTTLEDDDWGMAKEGRWQQRWELFRLIQGIMRVWCLVWCIQWRKRCPVEKLITQTEQKRSPQLLTPTIASREVARKSARRWPSKSCNQH